MEKNIEYNLLRQLLINKILNCDASLTPTKLNKNKDEELVNLLFQNAVEAEKKLWIDKIIKIIVKIEPGTENKYKNVGTNLLTSLINVVKRNNK